MPPRCGLRSGKAVEAAGWSRYAWCRWRTWRYPLAVHDNGLCDIDAREFAEGRRYEGLTPVALSLRVDGPPPEFTFAAGQMPIVSHRLAAVIESLCPSDVQRFPVVVLPAVSGYEILNVVATADCLDETRSEFSKFTVDDSVRPDRAGDYRAVARLRIDPRRTTAMASSACAGGKTRWWCRTK